MRKLLSKLLGDQNKKYIKEIQPLVDKANSLEDEYEKLSETDLKSKTKEFKARLEKGETLDDILPEAFAVVREVSKRTTKMRHYDVQLIGGISLHQGKIAEMRTGEGKTLVATLPIYLNALAGKGAHVVTVNDYLAKRDAVWMAQVYDYLGMTVGIVQNQRVSFIYDSNGRPEGSDEDGERDEAGSFKVEDEFLRPCSRKEAYRCDITYGTNNEYGFDYLRDNMAQSLDEMVMRPGNEMHYCVIDEVDSILIDEARTPLIISAPAQEAAQQYYQFANIAKRFKKEEDYEIDEKLNSAVLTAEGIKKVEGWLGVDNLYVEAGMRKIHHLEQALKAEVLFIKDKQYVVEADGSIVIIDEFTGRKMPGRRYSEGLHQAIEAKEGSAIQRESQTLATITFQNLFRMYKKLSGMTGTAKTEEEEFIKIYSLDVIVIPTNRPDQRKDHVDGIYKTEKGKNISVLRKIKECQERGQPILVGTISVEKNEELSRYLDENGVKHEVLNAKNHEREGEIVAQAGRVGAVTLATNMAGRGVDIKLGGAPYDKNEEQKVKDLGGLFVLGTERHESRRIDNQLRGRSARQGDPGETQFYVSTGDDLMRIFAGDRLKTVLDKMKVPEDMPIETKIITKMLEGAQKKVESHHFDIRKHVLQYDDVLSRHRGVIYEKRRAILDLEKGLDVVVNPSEKLSTSDDVFTSFRDLILSDVEQEIEYIVSKNTNVEDMDKWDLQGIYKIMHTIFSFTNSEREELLHMGKSGDSKLEDVEARDKIVKFLMNKAETEYNSLKDKFTEYSGEKEKGEKMMKQVEKGILLRAIDTLWVEHLVSMSYLRGSIGLQGYGQRDPLVEYKKESYFMFNQLLADIQKEVVYAFFKVSIGLKVAPTVMANDKIILQGAKKNSGDTGKRRIRQKGKERDESGKKVGRNDPCTCGSGKKYKKCHGE
ncbi:MAG: preprotein translocase subunit SecA [Candidatus Magasanikbacteria bacterium]|nr:preprotein translocase subunit SecA [Candidatus Magasanikbacteria bacterium]